MQLSSSYVYLLPSYLAVCALPFLNRRRLFCCAPSREPKCMQPMPCSNSIVDGGWCGHALYTRNSLSSVSNVIWDFKYIRIPLQRFLVNWQFHIKWSLVSKRMLQQIYLFLLKFEIECLWCECLRMMCKDDNFCFHTFKF